MLRWNWLLGNIIKGKMIGRRSERQRMIFFEDFKEGGKSETIKCKEAQVHIIDIVQYRRL